MSVQTCAWPDCKHKPAIEIALPICKTHAVETYLAVGSRAGRGGRRPAPVEATAPSEPRTRPGVIYFARKGDLVKIGFTTSMRSRMSAVRPDDILATMPGNMKDEQALHYRFGPHWETGEWFRMAPDLMEFIASVRATAMPTRPATA